MRAGRLPTGGLVSLCVVLAAIGVVVVAGAPTPRTRIDVQHRTTTVVRTIRQVIRVTASSGHPHAHPTVTVVVVGARSSPRSSDLDSDITTRRARPRRSPSNATTTTTSSTTTTTMAPTPTTQPPRPAEPSSRAGVFEGGATTATARVDAVHVVTVVVPSGIQISLTVACGLTSWSATGMTRATVHVLSGGAACTATFSIPTTAPQPARWQLTTA